MELYELPRGARFTIPAQPNFGVMTRGRIDGVYVQCVAEDPQVHKYLCERYDQGCPFFALFVGTEVEPA